ncbi:hypothetical protein [Sphingobacterium multivorum]|uniref:hypothetical protein n=1 Tax=Sphingobacterium multivorum TaxID=28454 RepID=UPI003DA59B52
MAYLIDNTVVVTKEELVPSCYPTYDSLKKALSRYKDKKFGPKRFMKGGNGRFLLIDYDTLPKTAQEKIEDPRKNGHPLAPYFEIDSDAVRFYSMYQFQDGTYLSEEHQQKYTVNASTLKAVLRLREARISEILRKNGKPKNIFPTLLSDAHSYKKFMLIKHHMEHSLPVSARHFKDALNAFEKLVDGKLNYASVISGKHKNSNSRKVFDHTLKLLNDMFADRHRKPTATEVHKMYEGFLSGYIEVINNSTGEVYDPSGYKALSFATVNNYLNEWKSAVGTMQRRSSNRELKMGKFKPYWSFDMPKCSGSIISIDDRQPPFETLENGKRVWFYLGVDIASRAIICQVYGETKEGIIIEFYRQLVRNYHSWGINIPAELECEMSLNSSFTETFLKEGAMFQYVKMEANNPRGKYIERVNKELRYSKEKKHEGWIARPKANKESNQPGIEKEKLKKLPYSTIIEQCLFDIEEWNNEGHPEEESLSRWEYFQLNQHPDVLPTNYLAFMKYIGKRTETSCNVGNIQVNYGLFLIADNGKVAKGETLIRYMNMIEGKDLEVYWLDDNEGKVFKALAYVNGEYACELIQKPRPNRARIERTDKDKLADQELAAYTNTVESYAKRVMGSLDSLTIIDNTPKPERKFKIEQLTRRKPVDFGDFSNEDPEEEIMEYVSNRKSLKDRI